MTQIQRCENVKHEPCLLADHCEVILKDAKNQPRTFEVIEYPMLDENQRCLSVEGIAHDISELKAAQEKLYQLSFYDELTGLANRRLFMSKAEQLLALSERQGEPLAILFLDLNKFKHINDTFGHEAGDATLVAAAERIQQSLRHSDLAARVGGDEFIIILPDTDAQAAEVVANKIIQSLNKTIHLDKVKVNTSISIGIALYPEDGKDLDTLIKHADDAMYYAKQRQLGYTFYRQLRQAG